MKYLQKDSNVLEFSPYDKNYFDEREAKQSEFEKLFYQDFFIADRDFRIFREKLISSITDKKSNKSYINIVTGYAKLGKSTLINSLFRKETTAQFFNTFLEDDFNPVIVNPLLSFQGGTEFKRNEQSETIFFRTIKIYLLEKIRAHPEIRDIVINLLWDMRFKDRVLCENFIDHYNNLTLSVLHDRTNLGRQKKITEEDVKKALLVSKFMPGEVDAVEKIYNMLNPIGQLLLFCVTSVIESELLKFKGCYLVFDNLDGIDFRFLQIPLWRILFEVTSNIKEIIPKVSSFDWRERVKFILVYRNVYSNLVPPEAAEQYSNKSQISTLSKLSSTFDIQRKRYQYITNGQSEEKKELGLFKLYNSWTNIAGYNTKRDKWLPSIFNNDSTKFMKSLRCASSDYDLEENRVSATLKMLRERTTLVNPNNFDIFGAEWSKLFEELALNDRPEDEAISKNFPCNSIMDFTVYFFSLINNDNFKQIALPSSSVKNQKCSLERMVLTFIRNSSYGGYECTTTLKDLEDSYNSDFSHQYRALFKLSDTLKQLYRAKEGDWQRFIVLDYKDWTKKQLDSLQKNMSDEKIIDTIFRSKKDMVFIRLTPLGKYFIDRISTNFEFFNCSRSNKYIVPLYLAFNKIPYYPNEQDKDKNRDMKYPEKTYEFVVVVKSVYKRVCILYDKILTCLKDDIKLTNQEFLESKWCSTTASGSKMFYIHQIVTEHITYLRFFKEYINKNKHLMETLKRGRRQTFWGLQQYNQFIDRYIGLYTLLLNRNDDVNGFYESRNIFTSLKENFGPNANIKPFH